MSSLFNGCYQRFAQMSIDSSDFHVVVFWGGIKKPPFPTSLFIDTKLSVVFGA
jgi:hypothetical protein